MVSPITFLESPTKQVGADENLLVKDHTHTFVNRGGEIGGRLWCLIFSLSNCLESDHKSSLV